MIYAMSDIHGCLKEFEEALGTVDLNDRESKLILLGDYCDRGPESLKVYRKIMELQDQYPGQVIALRGNHEEMLIEYVDNVHDEDFTRGWMLADSNLATARSFLGAEGFREVKHMLALRRFEDAYRLTVDRMKKRHGEVLSWIRRLPYTYESPFGQVFVHAGIDEEAGEWWKVGTPEEFFTEMRPEHVGESFYLDVIAGHVSTETVSGIPGHRGVWHDGASHYYVDGDVLKNGRVEVLSYDEKTGNYNGEGLNAATEQYA